jgi:hypothetical protein
MNVLIIHGTNVLLNQQLYKKSKKIISIPMERNPRGLKTKLVTIFL